MFFPGYGEGPEFSENNWYCFDNWNIKGLYQLGFLQTVI